MPFRASPFRYTTRDVYPSSGAIYKAWFGKKYLIWKAKSLQQSCNMISVEIDQRLRLGLKPDDPFTKVCPYIRKARVTIMEIEAIVLTDNPAELLIAEYNELKKGENDPDCLNVSFFPAVPKWMPKTAEPELREYVSKIAAQKKAPAKKSVKKLRMAKITKKKQAVKSKKKATVRKR